jgi:hypothetical protein
MINQVNTSRVVEDGSIDSRGNFGDNTPKIDRPTETYPRTTTQGNNDGKYGAIKGDNCPSTVHNTHNTNCSTSNGLSLDAAGLSQQVGSSHPGPNGTVDPDDDPCNQVQLSRKMFCSHSSILNVLANPDLDFNIPDFIPDPLTRENTPLIDPSFSLSSWHDISLSKFNSRYRDSPNSSYPVSSNMNSPKIPVCVNVNSPIPPTTLILSSTSDDDHDIAVLPDLHSVMVFETDEEGDMEDLLDDESPTFVMPQISVSDGSVKFRKPFQISILSSRSNDEIREFVTSLRQNFKFDSLNIHHINLSKKSKSRSKKPYFKSIDPKIIKNSDLIFVINDGSKLFLKFLSSNFADGELSTPKLTIINMTTVNYFINLFELINLIKPYQIWKASSLTSGSVISKCQKFIDLEFGHLDLDKHQASTMYSSLVVSTRKDYKAIERQFRLDLSESTSYYDPLQLSRRFSNFSMVYSIFRNLFNSTNYGGEDFNDQNLKSSRFWLVASFTLGVGLGVSIASGAATMFGCYMYESIGQSQSLPIEGVSTQTKLDMNGWDTFDNIFPFHNLEDLYNYIKLVTTDLKSVLNFLVEYVKGGFEKLVGIMVAVF